MLEYDSVTDATKSHALIPTSDNGIIDNLVLNMFRDNFRVNKIVKIAINTYSLKN